MELLQIYQCLCDLTRLRILNLLTRGPLCVCHLQAILDEPQVKISKHLGYLKKHGLLEVRRHQNWMIYSLPERPSPELEANLKCLQDCVQTEPNFKRDLKKLHKLHPDVEWLGDLAQVADCCNPRPAARGRRQTQRTQ